MHGDRKTSMSTKVRETQTIIRTMWCQNILTCPPHHQNLHHTLFHILHPCLQSRFDSIELVNSLGIPCALTGKSAWRKSLHVENAGILKRY